jgi:protein ImuB
VRSTWRVACVRIPRFPIGAVWQARRDATDPGSSPTSPQLTLPFLSGAPAAAPSRSSDVPDADAPHWDARLLALAEGDAAPGRRLRAVSAAAGRLGVRAGMTVAAARARCAALVVWPWDDAALATAVTAATAALLVASPQVTPVAGAPGTWWVGAGGLDGVGGEAGLARALARLASAWHPAPRVGIADSCVAARAATWDTTAPNGSRGGPAVVVPRGGCAAYLAGVPLMLVPMDEEVRQGLAALGIRVAGGLAALDPADVERRWGAAGVAAWRLACGEDRRRPVLARPEVRRTVSAELPVPSATVEPVLFLVRAALDRLSGELVRDGVGAAVVALTLAVDAAGDGAHAELAGALGDPLAGAPTRTITREIRLPRPVARAAPRVERCRALRERVALPAPVLGVTVAVTATGRLSGEQGDLLTPAWQDPAAAEAAFARLRAELGPDVVVRPALRDAHRPERAGAWVPADAVDAAHTADAEPTPADVPNDSPDPDVLPASLRLLEPPEPARVGGRAAPEVVEWRGRRLEVAHAVGPERLAGEWWQGGHRRDYWRCDTPLGELLLFLDHAVTPAEWRVQGWMD